MRFAAFYKSSPQATPLSAPGSKLPAPSYLAPDKKAEQSSDV